MFGVLIAFLLLQRTLELLLAERNRKWSIAQGGVESGQRHYAMIVGMHALYYASLIVEWHSISKGWSPVWPIWLGILGLAQSLRISAIVSLGHFWNTRIIVIPGRDLIRSGPYRLVRHPNYVAVSIELLAVAMLCGAYVTALCFTVANALVLRVRIHEEERALNQLLHDQTGQLPRFIPWRLRIAQSRTPSTTRGKS